ncbi:UDP-glycosyltransferase 74G1-like [Lotus japonicus]|uniref:UDP-glycosyltransferase 74G1-like n=1 Tax=Lotus japonicus TaxID=34305 RepID=UPI00258ECBBC|nr:UDP-glycosyltransferase 74G1-like [Lotus japonicus]
MEKKSIPNNKVHCLVLPYPAAVGHINPMLQFSKLLQHEGVRVTLVTTHFHCKSKQELPPYISLEAISDGFDSGGFEEAGKSFKAYLDRFWQEGPRTLAELIEKLGRTEYPVDCVIYDALLPWALDVAKRFGIMGVAFFTQNLSVNSIYYHVHLGNLHAPLTEEDIFLPGLPKLQHQDMPSFFFMKIAEDPVLLELVVAQFSNIDKADWILCNSFYELDKEVTDWTMKTLPKFRTIGPSIPSMFLGKEIKDDEDYGVAKFTSEDYMAWLNDRPKGSVVYVCFGSYGALNEEQTEEIACGLRESGSYFLWVVRDSEQSKIPKDFEKKSEKGFVVTWCSQLKVLAHEAIGCFITHCGWNSILEALSLGVPTIAMQRWSDQCTNAKLIVDVWKTGIRAPLDERGIVRRDALKHCIFEIMESEKGKEIKSNAMEWKNLAAAAVSKGGSSHKYITEFVDSLFHLKQIALIHNSQINSSSTEVVRKKN